MWHSPAFRLCPPHEISFHYKQARHVSFLHLLPRESPAARRSKLLQEDAQHLGSESVLLLWSGKARGFGSSLLLPGRAAAVGGSPRVTRGGIALTLIMLLLKNSKRCFLSLQLHSLLIWQNFGVFFQGWEATRPKMNRYRGQCPATALSARLLTVLGNTQQNWYIFLQDNNCTVWMEHFKVS